ncbi:MAG: S-layer homology domain-containing protein, partial [Synechococcales bacterium]|nr:S-layer homology domain-containing protein [Synechococcales bacterium]
TDRTLPLKDIANHWAKNAILLAVRTGFMSGYRDGRFGPDDRITRQEVLVALVGGLDIPRPEPAAIPGILKPYQDTNQIADWAKLAIAAALQAKLSIDAASTFKPRQAITRGETAILISQALIYKERSPVPNEDQLTQPPDPSDSADQGPQVEIFPLTEEPTLVHVDASDDPGKEAESIVIRSLTATVKVVARPSPNSSASESRILQAGQSYLYCKREGKYRGFRTVIEMAERQKIIESPEMQSFLDDWSEEALPLPRAVCESLFKDRLLKRDSPLTQPNLNEAIVQAMKDLDTFSTLPFIAATNPPGKPGENSCGWAVNQVLAQARIDSLSTYVPTAKSLLESRGTLIADPKRIKNPKPIQAGDIVIAGTEEHMGICLSATTVRSASRSQTDRPFGWDSDINFQGFFKEKDIPQDSIVYRLQSSSEV